MIIEDKTVKIQQKPVENKSSDTSSNDEYLPFSIREKQAKIKKPILSANRIGGVRKDIP